MKSKIKNIYIIKLIVFVSIIIIPIIYMNHKSNLESEIDNRMLTELSDIFNEENTINDVAANIEEYVDDRIGFRSEMLSLYGTTIDRLFGDLVHPSYDYGKDGHIYLKLPENSVPLEFQETFSSFIEDFEDYCNERGIKFLYTLEPNKSSIYPEYLPEGYNRSTANLDYFTELLEEKEVNFLNNVDTLLEAKESPEYENILLYDRKYDAGHWNETGAIVGFTAIIDRLNELDNRIGSFDINNFEEDTTINETLVASNFSINEESTVYNLKGDNIVYIDDYEDEIERHERFRYFTHYKNLINTDVPRILIFAGSYFNDKEKFITSNFSEVMKIHNYRNVIDYEYYINIYNPDIVLFESTEYTNTGYHYPVDMMEEKVYKKSLESYENLTESNFVKLDASDLEKIGDKITKFVQPIESDELLYAYANINDRMLDCKIKEDEEGNLYIEVSLMTEELENIDKFDLYFVSEDEEKYQKVNIKI